MIYQYVKRYLKNTIENPRVDFTWNPLDNIKFFTYVENRYTLEEFTKELSEVKQAFKDFFEPVGKVVFRYKEDTGIKFRIFPYTIEPKDSKHLKNIINIINHNRKYIEYPYQGQADQIAIYGKIRRDINKEVFDTQESVNVKELINYAIKKALNLSQQDIITQLKRKYIVKIFEKNTQLGDNVEVPKKREGVENRFNGYTTEEIKKTYNEIFLKDDGVIKIFLDEVMKKLFKGELNFKTISNEFYEKNALKIIHAGIVHELANYVSLEKDYLLGVAGYTMRINFQKIHEIMARELIKCIYEKDTNANNFLLYYNGNIVLIDNVKHKIPSLETEDGQQWNNASLIGICNLWMNTKKKQEEYETKLLETEAKIKELEKDLVHVQPRKEAFEKKIEEINTKLKEFEKKYLVIESEYKYLENASNSSNEYFTALKKFEEAQKVLQSLKEKKQQAKTNLNAIIDANSTTYSDLKYLTNQETSLKANLRAQELNVSSKNTQIDPILRSVVKVLMERTKVL